MTYTIDASVWVASELIQESRHAESRNFIDSLEKRGELVICPILCCCEVVAAIARPTGNIALASYAAERIRRFPIIRLVNLTKGRSLNVESVAANLRLRGADSVYVALAQEFGATLITWDAEVIRRAAGAVAVMTPTDWLASPPPVTPRP